MGPGVFPAVKVILIFIGPLFFDTVKCLVLVLKEPTGVVEKLTLTDVLPTPLWDTVICCVEVPPTTTEPKFTTGELTVTAA